MGTGVGSGIQIVYMGTAAFAVPPLQRIFEQGYAIAGVLTQPDKPGGRGQSLQFPPVKRTALELQLKVYQPARLNEDTTRALIEALRPDLVIVVAYGKIIPPWLIHFGRYGVMNVHGSLLPKYRGAAPIQWAIANGESETGVCTMQIDEGLDTGPVYLCEKTAIHPEETAVELSGRMAQIGSDLTCRTIEGILSGRLQPVAQDHQTASYAPMLKKEDGFIDWSEPAQSIHNKVRAFKPWPGTVARFRAIACKILKSKVGEAAGAAPPGAIVPLKRSMAVACGDGVLLDVLEVQVPDRKPFTGADFINGMRVLPGEKFERMRDN